MILFFLNIVSLIIPSQDAQKAIPKGTLLAILITSIVYAGLCALIGAVVVREASGSVEDLLNGTAVEVCQTMKCEYGLLHDFGVRLALLMWCYFCLFVFCFVFLKSFVFS